MQKILFVLSEYGYWGEELIGFRETLEGDIQWWEDISCIPK